MTSLRYVGRTPVSAILAAYYYDTVAYYYDRLPHFLKPITDYKCAAPSFIRLCFHTIFKKRAGGKRKGRGHITMRNAAKSAAALTARENNSE